MNNYTFTHDNRKYRGKDLVRIIPAASHEEAKADWDARLAQRLEQDEREPVQGAGSRLKVLTTREIQATAMTPAALAVKRRTPGILGGKTWLKKQYGYG